jgi:hypothetical protein
MEDKDKKEQPPIVDQVKEYLETYMKLVRLRAIEKGTSVIAAILTDVVVILALLLTLLFASLTLALYLGKVLGAYWQGFGYVAIFYVIVIVIVMIFRKNMERPIVNALLKKLL